METTLPKFLSPKLAYLLGYLQGDGSIESNEKRINFSDEYIEQINQVNSYIFDLFDIKGKIYSKKFKLSKKECYRLEVGSKVLNSYFSEVFEINRGIKHNLKIPKQLLNNNELLKWYLMGIYDADGTLPKNPSECKQFFIDITLKDMCLIDEIKICLNGIGIKTLKPYCRIAKSPNSDFISKTWELRIRKREDIIKFLNKIGFHHPDKKRRMQKALLLLGQ